MNAPLNFPLAQIDYPDSDGRRMAENTLQFQWIMTLQGGMDDLFRDNPDVFLCSLFVPSLWIQRRDVLR